MDFLKKRGLKVVLWLPVIILSLNIFSVIFTRGFIIQMDVTEGTDIDALTTRYLHTYSHDIGLSLAEKARIPLFSLIFLIYKLSGLPQDYYIKIKIMTLFVVSFAAFVLFIKKLLNDLNQQKRVNELYIELAAIIGGIYYVVNFWSANRLAHFLLFFSSVTIPITFYYIYSFLFKEGEVKKLVILLLLLAVFSATPHTILFITLIVSVLLLVYLVRVAAGIETKKGVLLKLGFLSIFVVCYLLTNMYWILPFLATKAQPDAVLTISIVKIIARYATLDNAARLMGYWLTEPAEYLSLQGTNISGSFANIFNKIKEPITYLPFIITILVIVVETIREKAKNKSLYISLAVLLTTGLFLSTSSGITNAFYTYLMFYSPIKAVGWIFREYDKFGIIIAFVYSTAISLAIFFSRKNKALLFILSILITTIIGANAFFFQKKLLLEYSPQQIPSDFSVAVKIIEDDPEMFNVLWYPGVPKPLWSSTREVRFVFTNKISPKPTLTIHSSIINYVNHIFKKENLYGTELGKNLDLVGVKYLIIRKDGSVFANNILEEGLRLQEDIELVHQLPLLSVYKNKAFSGYSKAFNNRLISNSGFDVIKSLPDSNLYHQDTYIESTDKIKKSNKDINTVYLENENVSIDKSMSQFKDFMVFPANHLIHKYDGNPGDWKIGSTENLNHAEIDFFFENMGVEISQFDFQQGIAIAKEGLEKTFFGASGPRISVPFSAHPQEIEFKESTEIHYTPSVDEDIKYWKIARSNKFEINNMSALEIKFRTDIDESFIPHFKVYLYDKNLKTKDIVFLYPNERGLVNSIIKLPEEAFYADFSIWTTPPKRNQTFILEDFYIKDASKYSRPVQMSYKDKKTICQKNCHVYARLLRSSKGGMVKFKIGDKIFNTNTFVTTDPENPKKMDRLEWVKIGVIDKLKNNPNVSITNIEGFNVINAVVTLNYSQYSKLQNNIEQISSLELDKQSLIPPNEAVLVKTTQIEPTRYKIKVGNIDDSYKVLGISLPYDEPWVLKAPNGQEYESQIINGYINGFYVGKLENGSYYVEHTPQRYFILGTAISSISYFFLLISLIFVRDLSASKLKSKSQG